MRRQPKGTPEAADGGPVVSSKADRNVEISVAVPKDMHRLVIGPRGSTIAALRAQYNCEIDVPMPRDPSSDVCIYGPESLVSKARSAVLAIVQEATAPAQVTKNINGSAPPTPAQVVAANDRLATATTKTSEVPRSTQVTKAPEDRVDVNTKSCRAAIQLDIEKFVHGRVVGAQRARLDDLKRRVAQVGCGGASVVVPDREDSSSIITITVSTQHAAAAQKAVEEFVTYYELLPHVRSINVIELGAPSASLPMAVAAPLVGLHDSAKEGRNRAGRDRRSDAQQPHQREPDDKPEAPNGPKGDLGIAQQQESTCRPCHPPLVQFRDLAASSGYTHPVLPKRQLA